MTKNGVTDKTYLSAMKIASQKTNKNIFFMKIYFYSCNNRHPELYSTRIINVLIFVKQTILDAVAILTARRRRRLDFFTTFWTKSKD